MDFIGASVGGLVGLWLLRYAPERIGRAVLANTAAQIGTTEHWDERIQTVTDTGVGALTPGLIENWFTRSYREQFPDEVRRFEETVAAMSRKAMPALPPRFAMRTCARRSRRSRLPS